MYFLSLSLLIFVNLKKTYKEDLEKIYMRLIFYLLLNWYSHLHLISQLFELQ